MWSIVQSGYSRRHRSAQASIAKLLALVLLGASIFGFASGASHASGPPLSGDASVDSKIMLAQAETPTTPAPAAAAPSDRVTNPPPKQTPGETSGNADDSPKAYVTFKTPYEFFLCLITVALGIAMMLLLVVMYWRAGPSEEFIRAFIVITVIFAALFLIVAGYNEKQTAPVFGLLGTVLGYVFGKVASPVATPDKTKVTQTGSQTGVIV